MYLLYFVAVWSPYAANSVFFAASPHRTRTRSGTDSMLPRADVCSVHMVLRTRHRVQPHDHDMMTFLFHLFCVALRIGYFLFGSVPAHSVDALFIFSIWTSACDCCHLPRHFSLVAIHMLQQRPFADAPSNQTAIVLARSLCRGAFISLSVQLRCGHQEKRASAIVARSRHFSLFHSHCSIWPVPDWLAVCRLATRRACNDSDVSFGDRGHAPLPANRLNVTTRHLPLCTRCTQPSMRCTTYMKQAAQYTLCISQQPC